MKALSNDYSTGQLIESFVISEIEKRRRLGFIKAESLFYFESTGGREIDLVYEEPDQVTAIEVKSTKSVTGRDLRNLREFEITKNIKLRRIIFYTGNDFYTEGSGKNTIEVRPIFSLFRLGRI